ncbi:MAG: flagellar biosynthetic protein FliR, partial [Anaerohalosphaera sp.]|nr:flagellar biosynthetic protein FliR [Anaerohalosphaera sp.]
MDYMIEKLLTFVLVLTRISAFFMILPVFGWPAIPVRIKSAMVIIVSIFICMTSPVFTPDGQISELKAALMLINEAVFGAALGITIGILFQAVKVAAYIIEQQIGLTMSEILDPLTGTSSQPLSSLLEMIFIILFLAANGHHAFLLLINKSYEILPAGAFADPAILAEAVIKSGSEMFVAALRLSGPILAVFLVVLALLAILSRIVPEMNILFIS